MLSINPETARMVEKAMREIYAPTKIDFNIYVSQINAQGVKVLEK